MTRESETLGGQKQNLVYTWLKRKEQWPLKKLSHTYLWVFRCLWWRCGLTVAYHGVRDTWLQQSWEAQRAGISPFEWGCSYCLYPWHEAKLQGGNTAPPISRKLKAYWAWPCPPEQDPVFPTANASHQEAYPSLLSSSIRGQTEWKPQSQQTNQTDHLDRSLA